MSNGKRVAEALSKAAGRIGAIGAVIGGGSLFGSYCLYNVDAGEAAVLFDMTRGGVQPNPRFEGTHLKVPYFQTVSSFLGAFGIPGSDHFSSLVFE